MWRDQIMGCVVTEHIRHVIRSPVMWKVHWVQFLRNIFMIRQSFYIPLVPWAMKPLEKLLCLIRMFTVESDFILHGQGDWPYSLSLTRCSMVLTRTDSIIPLLDIRGPSQCFIYPADSNSTSNLALYLKMSCDNLLLASRWTSMKNASRIKKRCRIFSLM